MKMLLAAFLATGLMISGLAQAAPNTPQSQAQTPAVAGAAAASSASTGGISAAQVVAVSIAVVATAAVVYGATRNNNRSTGTTGTH